MDASYRRARLTAGLSNRSGKEDQSMIHVLIKVVHVPFGRITVRFLWTRKGHK